MVAPTSIFPYPVLSEEESRDDTIRLLTKVINISASANSAGFPAAMVFEDVFESSSPYIHSASDTVSTISFSNIKEHIKVCLPPAPNLSLESLRVYW